MGHEKPDHGARPGIRPGAPARLWHLFDARHRSRQVPDRNRRHRWGIYRRRNQLSDPKCDPARGVNRSGKVRDSGSGHGGQHRRSGQDRDHRHRAENRGIRNFDPGILHRKRLFARRGRKGSGQAHLDGDRRRSEQIHAVQCRRRHGKPQFRCRGHGRGGDGRGDGDEHGGGGPGPGEPPPPRWPHRLHPRPRKPGIWPKMA